MKVNLQIGEKNKAPLIDNNWLRRDYEEEYSHRLVLDGTKQEVARQHLDQIQFLYIDVIKGGPVKVYRNAGASYYTVSDMMLAVGMGDCQRLSLRGSGTVEVYLAGK